MSLLEIIILAFVWLCCLCLFCLHSSSRQPWNWPLVGMLPWMLLNLNRIPDKFTEILELNEGTFNLKSFWFSGRDVIVTSDPTNVQHIMSKNFSNYPKGPESKRIFDVLGSILFNSDHDEWRGHRKLFHTYFTDPRFPSFSNKINIHCLVNGLMPVLDHLSKQGLDVDLQDVFQRFMFDASCMMITGYDPAALRIGFPKVAFSTAIDHATRAIYLRHILPEKWWMLLRWLGLGVEKKMSKAREILDDMAANYIAMRQEELRTFGDDPERLDALRCLITKDVKNVRPASADFPYVYKRDTIVGLVFAGRDTTSTALSWFFWLISQNPSVESKIRKEIKEYLPTNDHDHEGDENCQLFNLEELNKLVYLHGALCETLRLYPTIPLQRRVPIEPDILPSGHRVHPKTKVVICSYAIGRMKSIWGDDCLEFKPERWLTAAASLKIEPSNKFMAFSSGPRICPGRELSFVRMKSVAAAIIHNYNVQVIKEQHVAPAASIVLQMEHGLHVKITKRETSQS